MAAGSRCCTAAGIVVVEAGTRARELPGAGERGTIRRGASLIGAVVRHWSPLVVSGFVVVVVMAPAAAWSGLSHHRCADDVGCRLGVALGLGGSR